MAGIRIHVSAFLLVGITVAVAIAAIAVATSLGGRGGTARTAGAQQRQGTGAAQSAAANGLPPQCPSITGKPRFTRAKLAEFDRIVWCERYRETPNSSVDQFVGAP